MTLISAMALGADCIDDCDVLRSGRTADVLGHRVMAPSTLGTFLRAFTFGHVRQLDRVLGEALQRAWAAGAGPGDGAAGRRRRLLRRRDVRPRPSRARRSATPGCAAITRSSPRAPTPARSCTSGSGRARRTPRAGSGASWTSCSPASRAPARAGRGCCGPTAASGTSRPSTGSTGRAGSSRSACACNRRSGRRSRRSTRAPGSSLPDYPKTSIAQIAETTLGGRRLVVRRVRTLDRQGQLLPDLGAVSVHHQPHRRPRGRRGRAPPARRRRARDPRPQRPSARALPLRALLRQRRLDGDRRARAQPAALDQRHRPARPHHPRRPHHPPPTARAPRPPDPHSAPLDAAPARPLALAARLHPRARPHPSAPHRGLNRRARDTAAPAAPAMAPPEVPRNRSPQTLRARDALRRPTPLKHSRRTLSSLADHPRDAINAHHRWIEAKPVKPGRPGGGIAPLSPDRGDRPGSSAPGDGSAASPLQPKQVSSAFDRRCLLFVPSGRGTDSGVDARFARDAGVARRFFPMNGYGAAWRAT